MYAAVSVSVLAALIVSGHELTGGENAVAADQLQYLSWVESASKGWTINSLWTIPPQTGSLFLHPGFLGSALLHRAGVGIITAYELWKPISIALVAFSFAAYVRRLVPAGGARTAALALALFGLSPAGAIVGWNTLSSGQSLASQIEFAAGEVFAPSWQWGYMMTAIAVALMVLGLLAAERARSERTQLRWVVAAPLIAFFCSWLQPWQGAELVGAVVLCDLLFAGHGGRLRTLIRRTPLIVFGIAPLVYYRLLAGNEAAWKLAGIANNGIELWSVWVWLLVMGIYLPAVVCWLRRTDDWQQAALRVVPGLMLAQFAVIAVFGVGTFPFHAIQGLSLFLGILLVQAMLELRSPSWWSRHMGLAWGLCLLLCVPGTLHRLNLLRLDIKRSAQPYFLEPAERQVLDQLARDPGGGGVLAPIKAALSVPGHTGHPVWVGQISWTPRFRERVATAEDFFKNRMSAEQMRSLVAGSGAEFVYSDCGHPAAAQINQALGPLIEHRYDYGCADLFQLRRRP